MTPRSNSRLAKRKNQTNESSFRIGRPPGWIVLLIVAAIIIPLLSFLLSKTKYWDGETRLSVAVEDGEKGVVLAVFDPKAETISTVEIPAGTQVNSSKNLGTWRIGSIWELGKQEGRPGYLLSETVTKTFYFPTEAWSDQKFLAYTDGDALGLIAALLTPFDTNLTLGDKLRIAIFSLTIPEASRSSINLAETGYLGETKLADGQAGFRIKGEAPRSVASLFADETISKEGIAVVIINESQSKKLANEVGKIVESLGAKVVAVRQMEESENDCVIFGKHSATRDKIASIFSCEIAKDDEGDGVSVLIGTSFAERF